MIPLDFIIIFNIFFLRFSILWVNRQWDNYCPGDLMSSTTYILLRYLIVINSTSAFAFLTCPGYMNDLYLAELLYITFLYFLVVSFCNIVTDRDSVNILNWEKSVIN